MFNSKLLNYQRVLHFNNPPIYSLKSWQLIHPPPGEGLRPLSATSKTPSKMSEDLQFQLDLGELHETPKSTISPWYSHDIPMMCSLYPYYIPMTSLLGGWTNPTDKYESQIGSSSQLLGKIKIMFQTTNQYQRLHQEFCPVIIPGNMAPTWITSIQQASERWIPQLLRKCLLNVGCIMLNNSIYIYINII